MILGYLPIAAPEILKEWKVVINSVGQGYESTEGRNDYKTETETTYRGRGHPMDIGKSNNNFKNRKPKYFNCNKYRYMANKILEKEREENS